ncbi:hypothetical protein JTB14_001636 [Gonioctena quinquepunctata]|nr:hypothetical protein JTB14_001636 [Gonioctena quinquepunctata]
MRIRTPFQRGFLKNKSTETALYESVKLTLESLDNKEDTIGLFFDFTKAFDKGKHEILFFKLEKIGKRSPAIGWVKSYLSNREQIVFSNWEQSIPLSTNIGLPQGSLHSPTLFLIMNNNLPILQQTELCQYSMPMIRISLQIPNIHRALHSN